MASIEAPVLANQVLTDRERGVHLGGARGNTARESLQTGGAESGPQPRARLADSEIPKFWSAFDDAGLIASTALKVILLTGQRPGEVAHMRREHIKDGWWELPGEPVQALGWPGTKNGASSSRVAVGAGAGADRPVRRRRRHGIVFAGPRGGPVTGLDGSMRAICARLGAERATPHDLRRTFSTTVTGLRFGRDALNQVTNHREGGIANVYDRHGYAEENKHVMEAVAAKIMALVEGRADDNVVQDQSLKRCLTSRQFKLLKRTSKAC